MIHCYYANTLHNGEFVTCFEYKHKQGSRVFNVIGHLDADGNGLFLRFDDNLPRYLADAAKEWLEKTNPVFWPFASDHDSI